MLRATCPSFGVNGLASLIKRECPKAVTPRPVDHYKGKTIAVDASNVIWQIALARARMVAMGQCGPSSDLKVANMPGMKDKSGVIYNAHITGVFGRAMWMLENEITPVFVFDGKRPDLKARLAESRRERREKAAERLAAMQGKKGDLRKESLLATHAANVPFKVFEETREMLKLCGIPTLQAPYEAEAQCAELAKAGLVHGVATEDMDTLAFGSPRLIRGLSENTTRKGELLQEYGLGATLRGFKFDHRKSLADLCIVLGCDYCAKVPFLGPIGGLAVLRKFKTLDDFFCSEEFLNRDLRARVQSLGLLTFDTRKKTQEMEAKITAALPFYDPRATSDSKKVIVSKSLRTKYGNLIASPALKGSVGRLPTSDFAYKEAARLFLDPNVIKAPKFKKKSESRLSTTSPRVEALRKFCLKKGLSSAQVESILRRLRGLVKKKENATKKMKVNRSKK